MHSSTSRAAKHSRIKPMSYSDLMKPDEDWRLLHDAAERRKIQNRLAQRAYRRNMRDRTKELEWLTKQLAQLQRRRSISISDPDPDGDAQEEDVSLPDDRIPSAASSPPRTHHPTAEMLCSSPSSSPPWHRQLASPLASMASRNLYDGGTSYVSTSSTSRRSSPTRFSKDTNSAPGTPPQITTPSDVSVGVFWDGPAVSDFCDPRPFPCPPTSPASYTYPSSSSTWNESPPWPSFYNTGTATAMVRRRRTRAGTGLLLHVAVAGGDADVLRFALSRPDVAFDARDAGGYTALQRAVFAGRMDMMRMLAYAGA